jgi:DNA (cytosine-5)-methyltransferase 1
MFKRRNYKMKVLDLYSGAGGLTRGFEQAGFVVTGVDISEEAIKTFRLNNKGRCIQADLSRELIETDCEVIMGGPSCKPWSAVNLTRRGKKHKDYKLLSRYFKHIEHNLPQVFIMENVPLIANDTVLKRNIRKLERNGYSIMGKVITYGNYGAPTRRHRFLVFGIKGKDASLFFKKLSEYESPAKPIKDVIWELRDKDKGEVQDHVWPELKTIDKYRHYYETGKYGWYILNWKEPAPSFGNVMKTYILHPDAFNGGSTRVISVKEALLIMGFDSGFRFPQEFGLGIRYQMVVDSVSPIFSSLAAIVTKESISS